MAAVAGKLQGSVRIGVVGLLACVSLGALLGGCSDKSPAAKAKDEASSDAATGGSSAPGGTNDQQVAAEQGTGTSVDAPGGPGNVEEVAPVSDGAPVEEPVGLDQVGDFGNGVTARITDAQATQAKAELPGELGGPALQVTVEITNSADGVIDLDNVAVVLTNPSGIPVPLISSRQVHGFAGQLAASGSASGTYVFTLDPADRAGARLSVKYSADTPTVVFTGSFPNA